jgi:uncharacterized membrane protein HdeD (DUF308 family)
MKHWILWLVAGLVSLLGGIMALANPLAASLTAELLAGWSRVAGSRRRSRSQRSA